MMRPGRGRYEAGAARAAQAPARRAPRAAMHAANHVMWSEEWAGGARPYPAEAAGESPGAIRRRVTESLNDIRRNQCELLRHRVGNPFRPVSVPPPPG